MTIPLYIYKTVEAFRESMLDYVRPRCDAVRAGGSAGLSACTITECGYDVSDVERA